jgi:hypothetical protein
LRNTGPASLDAFVERECDCSSTGAPRAARRRCNCRRPERGALAARHGRTCTRSPCRGCPCCGDALDGSPCLRYRPCQAAGQRPALTLHAARMTHHACAFAYALKAHAQCSFALSVTPSARMTSCYTSTILMRSGQHARGRHGAGAMVASSMLHSTIRSAAA